jgi:hypothetical protein
MPYQEPNDRIRGDESDNWNIADDEGDFEGEESLDETKGKPGKQAGSPGLSRTRDADAETDVKVTSSRVGMSGGQKAGQRSSGGKNGQSVVNANGPSKKSAPAMSDKARNPKASSSSKGKMSGSGGRSAGTGGARGRQVAKAAAMTAKKAAGSSKRSTDTTGRTTRATANRNSGMSRGARNKGGSTRSSSGVRTSNARAAGAIKAGRR